MSVKCAGGLVEFRILGPVEVGVAGQRLNAGHARQRSVLAVLILDLGRAVPAELLIDRVWGEDPPTSVRNVLYGYVARLRTVLAGAGDPGASLTRHQSWYLLQADPEQVDVCCFRRMVAEASAAGGNDQRAATVLYGALKLWHGSALAGLSSPWLDGMRYLLEMERVAAVLDLNDIRLRQGEHGVLATELAEQVTASPADERLIGQLMLALNRSGRQAEALRRFEQTRLYLADELGADPGPQLQRLHQQILVADPALEPRNSLRLTASRAVQVAPRQLPAAISHFAGRANELAELTGLLDRFDEQTPNNARDAAQVRPLLPGGPDCFVLVTSRNRLTSLVAAEGAHMLTVDLLSQSDAYELVARRLGNGRVRDEPEAVSELIELCARLPIAVSIAVARAAAHPAFALTCLVAELRDTSSRLDVLDAGDPGSSIRAVFSWSYQNLSGTAARMFRLLSVHAGPDISVPAAASLAGLARDQARRAVGELTSSHLLAEHVHGRFTFHDLLRAYASDQARIQDDDAERNAAVHRLLDHYLHTGHAISRLLDPTLSAVSLAPPQPGTLPEAPADYEQAWAWAETEHQVLLAAATHAAAANFETYAWQILRALVRQHPIGS